MFFATMVMFSLASSFAHPVTPTIIKNLNLHDYMFGLALAVMMITNFLVSPFWGKMNSYIASRTSLLICCSGYGIAQLGFGAAQTEMGILLARLLAGVFIGGIFVSFLTYVINCTKPEDQSKYLIYSATIQSVAGALGYLVGGIIGEFSVFAAFVSQAVVLIITGVLFYFVCYSDAESKSAEKIQIRQFVKEVNPLQAFIDCGAFINKGFILLFLINMLINFGNTGFDQAFNYYLKDQLNLTSAYNGIIKAAVGFVSFVSNMTLCIWIIRKTNPRKSIAIITVICTIAAVGTIFIPNMAVFITLSVVVYAGYSVSVPVLQNLAANQADASQKNLVMGLFNATKNLGSIAGSLIAGFIYAVHVLLPFAVTAVIYGAAVAAAVWYMLYSKKTRSN